MNSNKKLNYVGVGIEAMSPGESLPLELIGHGLISTINNRSAHNIRGVQVSNLYLRVTGQTKWRNRAWHLPPNPPTGVPAKVAKGIPEF